MEAVNAAFLRIPRGEILKLLSRKESLFLKEGMYMFSDAGKRKLIDVQLRPWVMSRAQHRFFYQACRLLQSATHQVMALYVADPRVQQIVPLDRREHDWMMAANASGIQKPQAIIDRLDATATFTPSDWHENFFFLEPNSVGIGGVHYIPATCLLTDKWVLPTLKKHLPDLALQYPDDIRELMLKLFARHAKAIGRRLRRIALLEDRSAEGGTDEFGVLAQYYKSQGLPAVVADPREIVIAKGEVSVKGAPVDIIYRDTELREIIPLVAKEMKRTPCGIREAFLRNQVVSSMAGEFDHKSVWELFTNPDFTHYFTQRQRKLFQKHLLWTRLIWERKTTSPTGKRVDLARYTRCNRESLMIKPNRAFGGEGVVFGHQCTQAIWERVLAKALKRPSSHVVQRTEEVRAELFPSADKRGRVRLESYHAVTGFAATQDGMAVLGRSSKEAVVNVSRRGGLIAIWQLG